MPQGFQPIDCGRVTTIGRTFFQSSPSTSASSWAWFNCNVAARRAVGEGVKFCPRAGCGKSACPRPAELRVLKRLGKQTHSRAIKPDRLDPVRSFRTEHVERATERISPSIPNQRHQAGGSLAEVDRHARHVNLHAGRDHALRTARITSASRSGSTSPPARTTTSPITISTWSLRIDSKRVNLTGRLGAPANGATTPVAIALRRQAKSCDGSSPFDRAIADTFAPATSVCSTILAFSSSAHDR
ncbi:hypothetical protein SAMN05444321_7930 [Bradyrhizobium lablabi]|nr:hypothetical protein SAMN05444321_7930 [Bradyrhizobium lablabi]